VQDLLKILIVDYVDAFVNIAEIKVRLQNMTDEQLIHKINLEFMRTPPTVEIDNIVTNYLSTGRLKKEARLSLQYFLMNMESIIVLCADCEDQVEIMT